MSDSVHNVKKARLTVPVNAPAQGTEAVAYLRAALKQRRVKLTDLSRSLQIPYRTMQDYFKRNDMPVSVYQRICAEAGIPIEYALHDGRIKLQNGILASALIDVFGDKLPSFCFDDNQNMALAFSYPSRNLADLRRDAGTLAVLIEGQYDRHVHLAMDLPRGKEDD